MKTILHNLKSKLAATTLAVLGFGAINAQTCAVIGVPTYNGNGNLSMIAQASYQPGWESYIYVDFGDGSTAYDINTNFMSTLHNYTQNGTYLIATTLNAYDPLDSNLYCSSVNYDTLVISDIIGGPASCNLQVTLAASTINSTDAFILTGATGSSYNYSYIMVDGQTFPGADSMTFTFAQAGAHDICYYAEYSDSTMYCYDSTCIVYTSTGGAVNQCQASFFLWQDSTNVLGNGWLAINNSTGTGPLTYSWDFGDGGSSTQAYPTHIYNTPGNYVICLTIVDANMCTSSTCDSSAALRLIQNNSTNAIIGSLSVSAPTGISEQTTNKVSVNVAPNPMAANTKVNFESTTSMKGKIEIVNVLGAVTFSETIQITNGNNSININTENITSGIYFLKITSENKTLSTVKVVK